MSVARRMLPKTLSARGLMLLSRGLFLGLWLGLFLGLLPGLLLGLLGCESEVPPPPPPLSPVQLSATISKAEAAVGEPLEYTVTLDHQPGIAVEMPEVFSRIEGFLTSDIRKESPVSRDGRVITVHRFKLQALDAGSYLLPALEVRWKDAQGQEQVTGSPQLFVEIKTSLPADPDAPPPELADIKPLVEPPLDQRRLALLVGGGLTVLALLATGYLVWKRRTRPVLPPPPPPPPHEVALQALERLRAEARVAAGDARGFGFQLSEIFRRYVEDRYHIPALEATTEELLSRSMQAVMPAGRLRDLSRHVLVGADKLKFAQHQPSPLEAETLLDEAVEFVRQTMPTPPVEQEISPSAAGGEA